MMEQGLKIALWFFGVVFGFFALLIVMHIFRLIKRYIKKKFFKKIKMEICEKR